MKIYKELQQGTDEWLQTRLGKFGGTDALTVITNGRGLETLIYQKVAEILTRRLPDSYTNADLERGKNFEDVARQAYCLEKGVEVSQVGYVELNEYVGVSPDGLVGEDGLIEVKCPKDAVFCKFLFDKKIPNQYKWQMVQQMYVTNRQWVDYVVYNDSFNQILITRILRDEEEIKKLEDALILVSEKVKEIVSKLKK